MPRTAITIFLIIPLTAVLVQIMLGQAAAADAVAVVPEPTFTYTATTTPELTATAFYSIDVASERPLATQAADTPLPIASITKLITSAAFQLESLRVAPSDTISVTEADVAGMGRAGALEPGERYPLSILPFPALLTSANTASALMARGGAGDLLEKTNQYAASHGFTHTVVADAHGLSAQNISTAREVAAWFLHISEAAPTVRDITRLKLYLHEDNGWRNNSPFIGDPRYQGGKHGYTEAAGRTAVAAFTEPIAGGEDREIVYVLLGSSDLTGDMATLRQHVQTHAHYR